MKADQEKRQNKLPILGIKEDVTIDSTYVIIKYKRKL